MEISLEKIIEIVTREVIIELAKNGVSIDSSFIGQEKIGNKTKSLNMDMSEFKTPILTANTLGFLDKQISEIVVPEKTIVTPGARDIIKKKKLTIIYKS